MWAWGGRGLNSIINSLHNIVVKESCSGPLTGLLKTADCKLTAILHSEYCRLQAFCRLQANCILTTSDCELTADLLCILDTADCKLTADFNLTADGSQADVNSPGLLMARTDNNPGERL